MDTVYLFALLVGGFFVLLSIFGGDLFDADMDADADLDGGDVGAGGGFVDLFSLRALFLFAAFFGLTGVLLGAIGEGEPLTLIVSVLMGAVAGLGGNYVIRRFGLQHISSNVTADDLAGRTAHVVLPFGGTERGKITVVTRGHRMQLLARALDEEGAPFRPGDEVVVLRMDGRVAEVVKPD